MIVSPNAAALARVRAKTVVPSKFDSADWRKRMPVELREAAWFSAKITDLRFLQETYQGVERATSMLRRPDMGKDGGEGAYQTRQRFVAEMQALARKQGLQPKDPRDAGTIKDVTSERRLGLIYDTQVQSAQEYARWKMGNDPDVYAAFPAREFYRAAARKVQRLDWPRRWAKAGGKMYAGRMIALKTDECWRKLSRFERPWPPFDFGSGMGWRNISRRECEKLGLIKPGEIPKPGKEASGGFNDQLQADVSKLKPELQANLQETFGAQVAIEDGVAQWRGNLIGDLFDKTDPNSPSYDAKFKDRVSLGKTWPRAIKSAQEIGEDIAGWEMDLSADDIRHALDKHSPTTETQGDQRGLTRLDFQALPIVIREPDVIGRGDQPGTLGFTKTIDGNLITIWYQRAPKGKKMNLRTMWAKKK